MKVMTFNIWNYAPAWETRRRLIADLIVANGPDVVALQETRHDFRYDRGKGQGEQLAEMTGYHPTFAVGQVYVPLLRVDEGLTILTRGKPARVVVLPLTMNRRERDDQDQRICLGVTVDHSSRQVHIFDTHFSLSGAARVTNALEVARFVEEQAGEDAAFLMGDLNAEPESPPIRFLAGLESLDGQTAAFLDCWTAVDAANPGYTYASFAPVRRIDYVFARNLPTRPSHVELVGGQAGDGVYASDHLGILADVDL